MLDWITDTIEGAGYLLTDQYGNVEESLKPVSLLVVAGLAGWYLYRVWTFDPGTSGKSSSEDQAWARS